MIFIYRVTNADVESVQPIAPYEPPKKVVDKKFGVRQAVIPGKPLSLDESSKTVFEALPQKVGLDQYKLDPILEKILNHGMYKLICFVNESRIIFCSLEYILVIFITTFNFFRTTESRSNFYSSKRDTGKLPSAVGISTF